MRLILLILISFFACHAITDTADNGFFATLASDLRSRYVFCTGDTANRPSIGELIAWKQELDSRVNSSQYKKSLHRYLLETGKAASQVTPCQVVNWQSRKNREKDSIAHSNEIKRTVTKAARAESLAIVQEIATQPISPVSIAGIPFDVSRTTFLKLAGRSGTAGGMHALVPHSGNLYGNAFVLGGRKWLAAFHFNENDLYCQYELEGTQHHVNDLDSMVRPAVDALAHYYEETIGEKPHSINRIGRYDIKEGQLSICKAWTHKSWSVSVGIAVHKRGYYAKAVATNRPLLPR